MIKVSHLSKRFEGQVVLDDLSLEVKSGEILVILGASGAGKSVLLRHLIGLMTPDKGTIEIDSVEITKLKESQLLKIRKNIGYLFQESALYDFMTVFENVAFPLKEHTQLSDKEIHGKVLKTLEFVDLDQVEAKFPVELSGGMKKRVGLARAVILDSKILFCDEPTSGLDPIRSKDISDLIRHISKELKCTTVITSHDLPNSLRIADRLALVHDGRIAFVGTKSELKKSKDPVVNRFFNGFS